MRALCIAALAFAVIAPAAPADAQPAFALGQPLDEGPAGSVSVRVIAGDTSRSVATVDVTLVVNGEVRVARTNGEGRATFQNIPPGATVQAKVKGDGDDAKDITSAQFVTKADVGTKLLLSTKPLTGGPGGGAGMPDPRRISGWGRPDSADPPGMLTVRITYDDLTDTAPPEKHPVVLVGYTDEEKAVVTQTLTDAAGRAEFKGLDTTGRTVYYAMTLVPRGNHIDRLVSQPTQLLPGIGTRMLLSAEKRTSPAPTVDDYEQLVPSYPKIQAGTVTAEIQAPQADEGGTVELVDVATGKVLASEPMPPSEPPSSTVNSDFGKVQTNEQVPQATLAVLAFSGSGKALEGATLELIPAEGNTAKPRTGMTEDQGIGGFRSITTGKYTLKITFEGRTGTSDPFDLDETKGSLMQCVLAWYDGIPLRHVTINAVPSTPTPVYVRLKVKGATRMGVPFLTSPETGMFERFYLGDRLYSNFFLHASVDDKYYAVNGDITIMNTWWTPYRAGDDGLLIPLPRGFTGGLVGEEDKGKVAPDPGYGFRVRRPLPPGGFKFQAGFSLPIIDGTVSWNLDLPWGTDDSAINLLDSPGMTVDFPPGATSRYKRASDGSKWLQIGGITIEPQHSLVMAVHGLPIPPAWKTWTPRIVGLIVLLLLVVTVWLTIKARKAPVGLRAAASAKIQSLMDELVEIERKGQTGRRKEQILGELEKLWDADVRTDRMV